MKLTVIIPTTGGPLLIKALRPRPGLPASAAFAEGDFRPLPWSGDYGRLTAPSGPLAGAAGTLEPHELRLSGSFDAGRSWEVPVSLAHLLIAKGKHAIVEPQEAEAMIFATGAVDLDLAPIPGDYALLDKIERLFADTRFTFLGAKTFFALLPPGGEQEAAFARLRQHLGQRLTIIEAGPLRKAAEAIETGLKPEDARPVRAPEATANRSGGRWAAMAAAFVLLAGAGAYGYSHMATVGEKPVVPEPKPDPKPKPEPEPEPKPKPEPAPKQEPKPEPKPEKKPETKTEAIKNEPPEQQKPLIAISEIRAPAGASCKNVLFGSASERRPVTIGADLQARPSRLDETLCGIALKPLLPGLVLDIDGELASLSVPATVEADGTQGYFLRANIRQKIVYRVQIKGKAADGKSVNVTIRHEFAP
jgi:hypothetical protein